MISIPSWLYLARNPFIFWPDIVVKTFGMSATLLNTLPLTSSTTENEEDEENTSPELPCFLSTTHPMFAGNPWPVYLFVQLDIKLKKLIDYQRKDFIISVYYQTGVGRGLPNDTHRCDTFKFQCQSNQSNFVV